MIRNYRLKYFNDINSNISENPEEMNHITQSNVENKKTISL